MTTNNGDWVFRAGISYAKDDDYTLEPVRAHSRCDARRKRDRRHDIRGGFKIMRQREFARQHAEVDAIPLPRLTASARRI